MSWPRPSRTELCRAIDTYLHVAYPKEPPAAVRCRLETLRGAADDQLYDCAVFERDSKTEPSRYSLRLGNQFYPHMKLVIERSPDGGRALFRADTHDRHCCPDPSSREYNEFCDLMAKNRELAGAIEAAWEREKLPTFKTYLKEDLARRGVKTPI